jgi:uncharacterized protein
MDINDEKIVNNVEFQEIIKELISNETVQKMKNFRQHADTDCFEHCYMAAYYSYRICKKLHWDYVSVTRAAMLHDLFLYDWRVKNGNIKGLHAFTHGKIAYENAIKLFDLSDKEKDIIIKHMWPVILVPPKYKEGFVLTLVDKYCAIAETRRDFFKNMSFRKVLRYSYVLLGVIIFRKRP